MGKFKFYALWLCLILIAVFILQQVGSLKITENFVLNSKTISNFEFWRLIASVFLHGGIVHLLYNLFALALFGSILEKFIGGKKFLYVFFLSGIFASLVSVNFYTSSLGASGAIYGILGCLVFIKPRMIVWAFGFPMPMFIAGILWVLGGLFGLIIPSNIGHLAHLSGMIVGFVFGLVLRLQQPKVKRQEIHIPETYMREWEKRYME